MLEAGPAAQFCLGVASFGVALSLTFAGMLKLFGLKIRGPLWGGDEVSDLPYGRAARWLAHLFVPSAALAVIGSIAYLLGI